MLSRNHCLCFVSWAVLLLAVALAGPAAVGADKNSADKQPNVLFIAVDDLNDWISCLGGNPDCRTPNIDRLAARGTLFAQAHCAAPACNPSRAALMSGIRPASSGVYSNSQPWRPAMPDAVTLPQLFMKHGYEAVGGGKIYHGGFPDDASWNYYEKKAGDPQPTREVANNPHSKAGTLIWGKLGNSDEEMDDYRITSWAIEYLNQKHDKPFFLACGIFRPHMPWQVPQKYYDMYPLDKLTLPNVPDDDLGDIPAAGVKMARPQGDHANILNTDNWRYAVQAYLASIAFADVQIGRLVDALDKSAYADNTIIVLWGDHGWHLGEKHHWRKFSLWEEATRAPLLFVVPGTTKPGTVCQRPVDFMNIYPTLADVCGLTVAGSVPQQLDGVSMRKLLENPNAPWDRPALTTHHRLNHALRSEKYRYIRYEDGSEELYDHDSDPMEWKNLAGDPKYAATKQELSKWLPKVNAEDVPSTKDGKGDGEGGGKKKGKGKAAE